MQEDHGSRRRQGARYPSRLLSSIGGITSGWRSSLETRPRQSIWSFVVEMAIAAGVFLILALIILRFTS